jgi:hypothetical protein
MKYQFVTSLVFLTISGTSYFAFANDDEKFNEDSIECQEDTYTEEDMDVSDYVQCMIAKGYEESDLEEETLDEPEDDDEG